MMNKFLIKTLAIVISTATILLVLVISSVNILKNKNFVIPQTKNILVIGDSHTECAINDNILTNAVNLSQSGLGYLYSYLTLKEFVQYNNHIDTVILSYFDRSLSKRYDDAVYSDKRYSFKLPAYLSFMTTEDLECTKQSPLQLALAYIDAVKYVPSFLLSNRDFHSLNLGGYLKLDRDMLKLDMARYDTMKVITEHIDLNTKQAIMLAKIKSFCQQHNITLLLMNAPTYQVAKYTNKALFDIQRDSLLKEYQYVDYSNFQLPDSCFGDVEHLNYKGAEIFSKHLKQNGIIPPKTQN